MVHWYMKVAESGTEKKTRTKLSGFFKKLIIAREDGSHD